MSETVEAIAGEMTRQMEAISVEAAEICMPNWNPPFGERPFADYAKAQRLDIVSEEYDLCSTSWMYGDGIALFSSGYREAAYEPRSDWFFIDEDVVPPFSGDDLSEFVFVEQLMWARFALSAAFAPILSEQPDLTTRNGSYFGIDIVTPEDSLNAGSFIFAVSGGVPDPDIIASDEFWVTSQEIFLRWREHGRPVNAKTCSEVRFGPPSPRWDHLIPS